VPFDGRSLASYRRMKLQRICVHRPLSPYWHRALTFTSKSWEDANQDTNVKRIMSQTGNGLHAIWQVQQLPAFSAQLHTRSSAPTSLLVSYSRQRILALESSGIFRPGFRLFDPPKNHPSNSQRQLTVSTPDGIGQNCSRAPWPRHSVLMKCQEKHGMMAIIGGPELPW